SPERGQPLAALLLGKSGGNPLFVGNLLRHLQQTELLVLDPEEGRWSWELDRIAGVGVTDNVGELLAQTLRRLPAPTRTLLLVGSCIGARFSVALAAAVAGQSLEEAAAALWGAVAEGHLVAVDDSFRFTHDRVQQAAY